MSNDTAVGSADCRERGAASQQFACDACTEARASLLRERERQPGSRTRSRITRCWGPISSVMSTVIV
jgi:hypothetical protein